MTRTFVAQSRKPRPQGRLFGRPFDRSLCRVFPTVQAIQDGYEIYVVEDCCGAREPVATTIMSVSFKPGSQSRPPQCRVMLEWHRELGSEGNPSKTNDAVNGHRRTHLLGAYGLGSNTLNYTMVHGFAGNEFCPNM